MKPCKWQQLRSKHFPSLKATDTCPATPGVLLSCINVAEIEAAAFQELEAICAMLQTQTKHSEALRNKLYKKLNL